MNSTWTTSLPTDQDMLATAAALEPTLRDHSRLARLVVAGCPGLVVPAFTTGLLCDCLRYIGAGPDLATQCAIQAGTLKSFLYLLHEAVELERTRACLDKQRLGGFKRPGTNVIQSDLWKANFSTYYDSAIQPADIEARTVEAQAEAVLMHLYYGARVSSAACAATLEIGNSKIPGAVEVVRGSVLANLGAAPPGADECAKARQSRASLYAELLRNVRPQFAGVERTAYGIFQARGEVHGRDLDDWYAAADVASP